MNIESNFSKYNCNNLHFDYDVVGWDLLFDEKLTDEDLEKVYQKIINKKFKNVWEHKNGATVIPENYGKESYEVYNDFRFNITDNNNWVLRHATTLGKQNIIDFAISKGAKMPKTSL